MGWLSWILLGAVGGWIGGLLVKGDEGLGLIGHLVLGIVAALIGGFIVTQITGNDPMDAFFDLSAWIVAIVSAVVLVVVVNMIQGRTRTGSGPI
jgi:uncharacterized membrane protein YeaQ/YmgE (transglycosylase-associated protein family)